MYIRVISAFLKPDQIDRAITIYRDAIVPAVQAQKGFISVSLLIDRRTGKAVSHGVWDTQADLRAGEASGYLQKQIGQMGPTFASQPMVEEFEVVVHQEVVPT